MTYNDSILFNYNGVSLNNTINSIYNKGIDSKKINTKDKSFLSSIGGVDADLQNQLENKSQFYFLPEALNIDTFSLDTQGNLLALSGNTQKNNNALAIDKLSNFVVLDSFLGTAYSFTRDFNLIRFQKEILNDVVSFFQVNTYKKNINATNIDKTKYFKKYYQNVSVGIVTGFVTYLQLKGLGYRSQIKNNTLILRVGLSALTYFDILTTFRVKRIKKHTLKIYGIDTEVYSEACVSLQRIRKPSAYNERGLIFRNTVRKLKQGKRSKF